MHLASGRWLQFYRYTSMAIQSLFCIGFIAFAVTPLDSAVGEYLAFLRPITPLVAIIALGHIIFGFLIYKFVAIKNEAAAPAILAAMLMINTIGIVHADGGLHSPWVAVLLLSCLTVGILGLALSTVPAFLVTFYYVLFQVSAINGARGEHSLIDIHGLIIVFSTYLLCFASWLYWRRYYIDSENVELDRLSGQLKSRKQISDMLIQSIADGIIVTETAGKITVMNPAAANMTEWSVEESIGIDVRNVVSLQEEDEKDINKTIDVFSEVLKNRQSIERTLLLNGRNGKKLIVSIAVSPVTIPESKELAGAVAVIRDVSQAHAEEKRRADFISTASHEMRTPVAAIEGYLALALNEKVSKIDSNARSYLMKAHSSSQHLGKLFQDLLTSAKAEDGRLVSHPTVIELGEFTEQLAEDLRFAAEKKGLLVERLIGSADNTNTNNAAGGKTIKPLYHVMADPDRLREVITNLFDNAVKYTESGKITIGLTGNNEVAQLFIKDTGVGIPEDDIPHMFQKFYRVDNSATRTIGGTGLGLFISRKIIELYKGRIWVESKLGKGSTFYINLPRLTSQQAAEAQKQQAEGS